MSGKLWVGDVGDSAFEEIDIVTSGGNYAWPRCEAIFPTGCELPGDVDPIFFYSHGGSCPVEDEFASLGRCIIGGDFAGAAFGAYQGDYDFGDCILGPSEAGGVYHAAVTAQRNGLVGIPDAVLTQAGTASDLAFGPDGALYYVDIQDTIVSRVTVLTTTPAPTPTSTAIPTTT